MEKIEAYQNRFQWNVGSRVEGHISHEANVGCTVVRTHSENRQHVGIDSLTETTYQSLVEQIFSCSNVYTVFVANHLNGRYFSNLCLTRQEIVGSLVRCGEGRIHQHQIGPRRCQEINTMEL